MLQPLSRSRRRAAPRRPAASDHRWRCGRRPIRVISSCLGAPDRPAWATHSGLPRASARVDATARSPVVEAPRRPRRPPDRAPSRSSVDRGGQAGGAARSHGSCVPRSDDGSDPLTHPNLAMMATLTLTTLVLTSQVGAASDAGHPRLLLAQDGRRQVLRRGERGHRTLLTDCTKTAVGRCNASAASLIDVLRGRKTETWTKWSSPRTDWA
jgi:hypothetical protein